MASKSPLKFRELIKRLKPYGIRVMHKRGKGSEVILLRPVEPGSNKGEQYPVKHHGDNTEISLPVIEAILRRFSITDFWN